ncbi:amidohydrolase family protein [Paenarthrobacter sp. NPDC089714]|uniref:amidohydrolase family protein n=1 Tax=Paenarthrobacter sp. NPDC089714 TaxID=3364377 RepID=UPI00380094AF
MRWDIHNHVIPVQAIEQSGPKAPFKITGDHIEGAGIKFPLTPDFIDAKAKLQALTTTGLGAAIVSLAPPLFGHGLEKTEAEAWAGSVNDAMRSFCQEAPERLRWLAHVALQSPETLAWQLRTAIADGAVGVQIGTSLAGDCLENAELDALWATAEELRVPILLHPMQRGDHPLLRDWYLQNVIGNPLETAIAVERMICAGIFTKHPDLRVVLVHGGGYLPWQLGRLRHASKVRPEFAGSTIDFDAIRQNIFVDSLTHDPAVLRVLVEQLGADHVMLGTDAPFDMAAENPVEDLIHAVGETTGEYIMTDVPDQVFGLTDSSCSHAHPARPLVVNS